MPNQEPSYHISNEVANTTSIQQQFSVFAINKLIRVLNSSVSVTKTFLNKKSNVFIFGAGGTTSWFLPKLLKIYNDAFTKNRSSKYPLEIVLVDADIVSEANLIRQNFISEDVNQNKSQVLSERYSDLYENIKVSYVPKFATYKMYDDRFLPDNEYSEEHFVDIDTLSINSSDIVINLVDNEGFKKKLDIFCSKYKTMLFSAGVNLYNGQAYFSTYGKNTNGYVEDHPDLKELFDEVSVHACADADVNGSDDNPEQMFNGNDMAASMLANLFQTVMNDTPLYKKIIFSTGVGVNASSSLKSYALLAERVRILLRSNEFIDEVAKASAYVARYGKDKTTPAAEKHYKVLSDYEFISEFMKTVNTFV